MGSSRKQVEAQPDYGPGSEIGTGWKILLSTLTSVASDLLNDALRLDNELSAWAATCSLRSVTEVTTKASGRHIPL